MNAILLILIGFICVFIPGAIVVCLDFQDGGPIRADIWRDRFKGWR